MTKKISIQINSYSFALYQLFNEEKIDFINDLLTIKATIKQNNKLTDLISSVNLNKKEKKEIIDSIYKKSINQYLLNFLYVLIDGNFFRYIIHIIDSFFKFYNKDNKRCELQIISNVNLSKIQINKIIDFVKNKYGYKLVDYHFSIDKELIGGFKLIIDNDLIIDYSIKSKINELTNKVLFS